ncbi:MAG: aldo/keto reductase [Planctomycetota bacterium]|jgi:predicted aldo/keto reductase-like oxidoreductase
MKNKVTRRRFMRDTAFAAAGLSSALAGCKAREEEQPTTPKPDVPKTTQAKEYPQVPRRKLGKTDIEVPALSLGTMFNLLDAQIILRNTLNYGIKYWDTSNVYANGNSELGIGKYKDLFLVTKAIGVFTKEGMEEKLQLSFDRMKPGYVDLHYFHAIEDPAVLTDEIRKYAEEAKKKKLIRYFGFTTHKNMAKCLAAAAKLDWIDVIMTSYNFRTMQDTEYQDAIDACHQANIGLVAMKTTGKTVIKSYQQPIETEADKKLIEHFLQRNFTPEQACIKLALQDKRFSSACVQMDSIAVLKQNVAAVLDKTKLTQTDRDILNEYAQTTCTGYCAGCANICDSALPDTPYVSDIMRYLMYYNSYGDRDRARGLFAQIPARVRNKLLDFDYRSAEARCPQHLPIRNLVAEAVGKLA